MLNKKYITVILIIATMYIFPLLLANVYYTDDMARIISGGQWDHDGRFIASYLSRILSFNQIGITSLFPYSIIISSIVVTISGLILVNTLKTNNEDYKIISYLPALFLLISPFYLENLAYRFDSMYMSLSILFSVLPFLFLGKKKFFIISVASLFLVLGLYQSTIMLYIAAMLCIQTQHVANDQKIQWKLFIYSCIALISAVFLYKLALKGLSFDVGRSKLLPITFASLDIIKNRIYSYYGVFKTLFWETKYILAILPILLLTVIGVFLSLNKTNFFKKIALYIVCIIGIALSILLPNIIIETMWLTARTFIVFPIVLFFCTIFVNFYLKNIKNKLIHYTVYGAYIIILCYSFMLSSVFGTILKNNEDYHNYLAAQITPIILESSTSQSNISLTISGSGPLAPKSQFLYDKYPIMNMLAPNYLSQGWYWGLKALSPYYNFSWPNNKEQLIQDRCDLQIIYKQKLYIIAKENNNYIIDFTGKCFN
ncbi:Hypothetical protein F387_01499 [Wohlfahrtiimonas chitiniclastica SH04]|uniref:Glucosyltransferase domain-containing protein n=1 Tax=Wohlfahrtiimonas chitiniclastica SH04 TaxID=1261130 RepID=L8XY61_9GAMM|nr:glucosyltransferase domain-containing protein [Wohlfahrtiimonas chitiniclastica]ELV07695.1 Hypothetical protein F387_01499 [Wohlfahrtiimonas chitiniclastica SH04]